MTMTIMQYLPSLKRKLCMLLAVQFMLFSFCLAFLPGAASALATFTNPADTKAQANCDPFETPTQIHGGSKDGKWWCKPKSAPQPGPGGGGGGGNPGAPGNSGCQGKEFVGLLPWWQYLPATDFDNDCNIVHFDVLHGSDVPLVLLAVVDDLLRIAALAAIAFVIYGAIKYTTSQGDPESASKAQSTIVNALIGLVIALVSIAFVSFISNQLGS